MRLTVALLLFVLTLVLAVFEFNPHGFQWIDSAGPFGSVDQWCAHATGLIVIGLLATTAINVLRGRIESDNGVNVEPDWEQLMDDDDPGPDNPSDGFHH